jgi:hypothetical protein
LWLGKRGGRFGLRFNLSFKARCALRLGEGPRAFGFSILIFRRCRGVCVKRLSINLAACHKRRHNNSQDPLRLRFVSVAIGNRKSKIENRAAGVVQWQNGSFPSCTRGFDSLHPLIYL